MASGMSGLFSKCEGHLGITLDWMQGPRASSQVEGENLEVFLELQWEVWCSSRLVSQGTSGVAKRDSNQRLRSAFERHPSGSCKQDKFQQKNSGSRESYQEAVEIIQTRR